MRSPTCCDPGLSTRGRAWRLVVVLVLGACLGLAPVVTAQDGNGRGPAAEAGAIRPGTVVIAPFVNISGDPSDGWIGAGIVETVTADLEAIESLSVIGGTAFGDRIATGDDPDGDARRLGRELGAVWLVAGGFQRIGEQLRITARVIDVASGAVGPSVKIDGEVGTLFALQDRIVAGLRAAFESVAAGGGRESVARENVAPARAGSRMRGVPPRTGGAGPFVNGNGNGNGNGSAATPHRRPDAGRVAAGGERRAVPVPPGGFAPPPEPIDSSAALTPENISGGIAIGDDGPRLGVAANAGILTGRPTVRPPRVQAGPTIDGRLDDTAWQSAVRITDFIQRGPVEGAPATEATDVYIAYDSQNLYFAFHAHYSDPGMLRANRVDRDQAFLDDSISVYFDPFLDQQRAYVFSVNGYGVQMDSIMNARGGGFRGRGGGFSGGGFSGGSSGIPRGDRSWDALFESGGELVADGFTAELAIPFKSLRYPQRDRDTPHRWGFQIARSIRGKDEAVVWSPYSREISGFLPQMGVLDGITNLSTSRNLEILPTLTAIQFGSRDSTGQFGETTAPEAGVNLKYGITSNLTADVAFNPDFSQIESDRPQIEVNQRFALFFSELRPFFLEGAEIFQMSGPVTLVHTRTIVDPDYGGKITGKVGKTTLGLLVANDAAPGNVDDVADRSYGQSANVVIGRARYDLYSESFLGAIFTNREFLDSHSRLGGVDGNFRLSRTQSLGFRAMQTEHQDLDQRQSSGQMFDVNYRMSSRHWSAFVSGYTLSPDFMTDVGFVRRVDQKRVSSSLSYRWRPETWVLNWGPRFNYSRNWNFDDILEDEEARFGLRASFAKNINVNFDVRREMERFLGINFDKSAISFGGGVNTSRNYSVGGFFRWGDEVSYSENPFLGRGGGGGIFMTLRPVSRFQSQINVNTSRLIDPRAADELVFDVKIFRALTTYQFTDRLLFRNIVEYNTFQRTVGLNMLATYRVNSGTVFYVGYDDHYQQGDLLYGDRDGDGIDDQLYPDDLALRQTNRAFFTKLQYLFRY